ncbi:universal stress protein, partial [Balneolaceae bacterium ANBcel3]|nr:universal stress protein [Balneolaceae bacterium ANBcel3]
YPFSLDNDVYPHIIEETEDKLNEELTSYFPLEFQGEAVVKIGRRAYELILEHAHKTGYDVIVMGSQGLHADHIIRGHVTEKVIRFSQVPVLSISGTMMPDSTNNILVPTDYSDFSLKAVLPASVIAGRLSSDITLFHVRELHGTEPDTRGQESDEDALERFRSKVADRLEDFLDKRPHSRLRLHRMEEGKLELHLDHDDLVYKIPLHLEQVRGISAHYEIVDYAEEYASMVVIATHGRSGLAHVFMGSTAEKVVQWAKIPVMTIRPKEMKAKKLSSAEFREQ